MRAALDRAWPTLAELGLVRGKGALSFHATAMAAVQSADFIQESVPEQVSIKHALYAGIEPALKPGAVVASSASGLTLSEMQAGWQDRDGWGAKFRCARHHCRMWRSLRVFDLPDQGRWRSIDRTAALARRAR